MTVSELALLCAKAQVLLYAGPEISAERVQRAIEIQTEHLLKALDD